MQEKDVVGHYSQCLPGRAKSILDDYLLLPDFWEARREKMKIQKKEREKYEKEFIQEKWSEFYVKLYTKGITGALEFVFKIVIKLMLANDKTQLPLVGSIPLHLTPLD